MATSELAPPQQRRFQSGHSSAMEAPRKWSFTFVMCLFLLSSFVHEISQSSTDKEPASLSLESDSFSVVLPGASNNGIVRTGRDNTTAVAKINEESGSLIDKGKVLSLTKDHFNDQVDKPHDSVVESFRGIFANISMAKSHAEKFNGFKSYPSVVDVFPASKKSNQESDFAIETLENTEDEYFIIEEIPLIVEDASVIETPSFVKEIFYSEENISSCLGQNGSLSASVTSRLSLYHSIQHSEEALDSSPTMTCSVTVTTKPELTFNLDLWGQSGTSSCSFRNYVTMYGIVGKQNVTWYHSCDLQMTASFRSSGSTVTMEIVVGDSLSGYIFTINVFAVASGLQFIHLSPTQGTVVFASCLYSMFYDGVMFSSVQCCFTSTEAIKTIRESRTATSTFMKILSSVV